MTPRFRPKPRGRYSTHRAAFRDPDCEDLDWRGRRKWRAWHEAGLRSFAATHVPGVRGLVRRFRRMGGWWQVTEKDLEELAETARKFLALALWHAGREGEPPFPQRERKAKEAASYLRAAGEVSRAIALARVRVEELRLEQEKRARLEEESRRRLEEWQRTPPRVGEPGAAG